jgi:uncharacterized membrane protein (DUF4010 family)
MAEDLAMSTLSTLGHIGLAGAVGFLIGFEREWTQALEKREHTFAGARTFTLIGAIGGLAGAMSDGPFLIGAALLVVGALTIYGYGIEARETPGRGGTTEMAIFATLLLGAAAGRGDLVVASAGAVAVAVILSLKDEIKGVARALDEREIHATLRFLAISVLVLPVLPNERLGPYGALNPRELWTMVVLISGLSFLGYWLMKAFGPGRGALATGLVGGLASSTATTLSLSKFARDGISSHLEAAAGIVMANVVMLARVGVILAAMSKATLIHAAPALTAGAAAGVAIAYALWRTSTPGGDPARSVTVGNPFELRPAVYFAAMIAAISIASAYAGEKFGAAGAYAVGAISGLADVDAMTLSGARQAAAGSLDAAVAAGAILLAVGVNIIVKAAMAATVAGRRTGVVVAAAFAAIIAAGVAAYYFAAA